MTENEDDESETTSTRYADPSDTFPEVEFRYLAILENRLCMPIQVCNVKHPHVELIVDITGITPTPPVDGLTEFDFPMHGPNDKLRELINSAFDKQSHLHFQLCTNDDEDNRETWRRLHFEGTICAPPLSHFSIDIPDDVRWVLKQRGQPVGRQTLAFNLLIKTPVQMTGNWDETSDQTLPPDTEPEKIEESPPTSTQTSATKQSDLGKKALSFANALVSGIGELASNLAAENKKQAEDKRILSAEKGTWYSKKSYPQLFEEIQNWLCHPIANGEQFSVLATPQTQQMQASLHFYEYVSGLYPNCARTITLLLRFIPLEDGTMVDFDWVVVQDGHPGSIHGPQMIRIVNNGIRHWCEVDTQPAL